MTLRGAQPVPFSPAGVSDTLDGSHVFPGACAALTNLIPDFATPNTWVPRPAQVTLADFTVGGFTTPGFISVYKVVGNLVYGMLATGRNAGHDEPFCFDANAGAFVTISGITNANTPISPSSTGAWEPPTVDVIGTKVVFTHPGFTLGGGVLFGWIDISNPAAPAWSGGNTTTNVLPSRPSCVANFNGRAWYLVNPATGQPGAYFSDVLAATVITNATQVLTFDDNVRLNCAAGLPLANQLGGIIQSLMVFKGNNIYQITGDAASSNLAKNSLNVATGAQNQNAITTTPRGLAFMAPDGVRVIDFNARVSDPIGLYGAGVNRPFVYALNPTRIAMACNANVLRVSTQNNLKIGAPWEEYWFDMSKGTWSGPHSNAPTLADSWAGTFITAINGVNGKLFQADTVLSSTSVFVENGVHLNITLTTSILPDFQTMSEMELTEMTINMVLDVNGSTYALEAISQAGAVVSSKTIASPPASPQWGQFNWGQASWASAQTGLSPIRIDWPIPVVSRKMQFNFTGNSFSTFKIGDFFMRMRALGYIQQTLVGA